MLGPHIPVRIAPDSHHSANRNPTTIMITPPLCACVVRVRLDPSSDTALFGITEDRCCMIVCTALAPASRLNAPSATSNGDGLARNALEATAEASFGTLSANA